MKISFLLSGVLLCLFFSSAVVSKNSDPEVDDDWLKQIDAPYTKKGADRCLKCHDEDNDYPIMPIFKSKHGQVGDSRSPMAGLQCEACHGPGANHAKKTRRGKVRGPIMNFSQRSNAPVSVQNKMCLQCHENHARIGWLGSQHQQNGLSCTSCHQLHVSKDPLLVKDKQASVCFRCHKKRQSEFQRTSTHSVRSGQLQCSNCHNVHDAVGSRLIDASNKNENCYECHAEKRGPLLWEHQPVTEDCTICHTPHGSNHGALLKKSVPFICLQCHSQENDHGQDSYNGDDILPSANRVGKKTFLQNKSCLNCHSKIHGSNHPSGVKFNR